MFFFSMRLQNRPRPNRTRDRVTCVVSWQRNPSVCSVRGGKTVEWQERCRTERSVVVNKGHKKRKWDWAADPPDADERKPFKIAGQRGDVQRTPKSQISKHCSLFIGISPVVVVVGWIKRARDSSFAFESISCRVLSPRPLIKLGLSKKSSVRWWRPRCLAWDGLWCPLR